MNDTEVLVDPIRILVVEDDAIQQVMLKKFLTRMGHHVVDVAAEGEDAVRKALGAEKLDLILMDIRLMGDLDGIDAAKKIRRKRKMKVIFVTGNTGPVTRKRAKEAGYEAFINKPVVPGKLKRAIQHAFPG